MVARSHDGKTIITTGMGFVVKTIMATGMGFVVMRYGSAHFTQITERTQLKTKSPKTG